MQFQSILAVLSLAIAASAAPTDPTPATQPSCNANQVFACCSSFNGAIGIGCIFSTLNILNPTCTGSQSLACCNTNQVGLINVGCVPISIAL